MKFSLIRNVVGLVAFSTLTLAKSELKCATLEANKNIYVPLCEENGNGEIVNLVIDPRKDDKVVEQVIAIESLQNLEIDDEFRDDIHLNLEKLTNLNELTLNINSHDEFGYRSYYEYSITRGKFVEKNGLVLPKNLKILKFSGIELNQEVADQVASLPELEKLIFVNSNVNKLNLEGFSKSKSLTSLEFSEMIAEKYDGFLGDNVLSNFKTIKNLDLEGIKLNNNHIKEISSMNNLENLEIDHSLFENLDYTPLKNLKLNSLKIRGPYTYGPATSEGEKPRTEFDETILLYLNQVKKVILEDIKASPSFVDSIYSLNNVEELVLKEIEAECVDIEELKQLSKLTDLEVDGKKVELSQKVPVAATTTPVVATTSKAPVFTKTVTVTRTKATTSAPSTTAAVDPQPTSVSTAAVEPQPTSVSTAAVEPQPTSVSTAVVEPQPTNSPVPNPKKHRKCVVVGKKL